MSGTTSKRRKFAYKIARFLKETGDPKITLESLLIDGLKLVPKALDRAQNPGGEDFLFLNYTGSHITSGTTTGIYSGELLSYERGADQSTIKIDKDASHVEIDALQTGDGKEFLGGSVYFGIAGNHVVVCAHKLKAMDLEQYINWFLIQKSKVLPADNRIQLADHIPGGKAKIIGVKGIEFKGRLSPSIHSLVIAAADQPDPTDLAYFSKLIAKGQAKGLKFIHSLFQEGFSLPVGLSPQNLTQMSEVEISVFLKWKGKKDECDMDFMNSIATNLSHVDDQLEYKVITKTGTVTSDDFKLVQEHSFKWNKGRPDFNDIFAKMAAWLATLVESGKVSP